MHVKMKAFTLYLDIIQSTTSYLYIQLNLCSTMCGTIEALSFMDAIRLPLGCTQNGRNTGICKLKTLLNTVCLSIFPFPQHMLHKNSRKVIVEHCIKT